MRAVAAAAAAATEWQAHSSENTMFSDIHVGKLVSAAGAANTEEQQTRSEAEKTRGCPLYAKCADARRVV